MTHQPFWALKIKYVFRFSAIFWWIPNPAVPGWTEMRHGVCHQPCVACKGVPGVFSKFSSNLLEHLNNDGTIWKINGPWWDSNASGCYCSSLNELKWLKLKPALYIGGNCLRNMVANSSHSWSMEKFKKQRSQLAAKIDQLVKRLLYLRMAAR